MVSFENVGVLAKRSKLVVGGWVGWGGGHIFPSHDVYIVYLLGILYLAKIATK